MNSSDCDIIVFKMVFQCCVKYCKTKGTSGFHGFPPNKERRLQWVNAIKIYHIDEQSLPNSFQRICKKHFLPTDYQTHTNGLVRLKYNAVPSQFLPSPIWLEHNYVDRNLSAPKPNKFKPAKKQTPKATKKTSDLKKIAIDFDSGIVDVSSNSKSQEQEVAALKTTILELREKLKSKEKVITAQNKSLKIKDKQLKLLRQKLKSNKITRGNIMKCIKKVFDEEEDEEKIAFFEMQLKNCGKHKNAHQFTSEQKTFCLAIYKQSPKCYRNILQRHFILPSRRTLGRHSAKLMFESGINRKFFNFLKAAVNDMDDIDKNCILVWDEMALQPHLDYSEQRDVIDGFVEMILMRRPNFATHALVFMVRGINKNYKQPTAYFYTDGLKHFELVQMVKLIGIEVLNTGLKVIGSVCDQAGNNVSTIKALIGVGGANNGQLLTYKLADTSVIHCFDVPHLLKGTRNNLQTKQLSHFVFRRWSNTDSNSINVNKQKGLMATWNDVSDLFLNLKGSKKLLPKITPEHIEPKKLKMKVSTATQVFSQTYGEALLKSFEKKQLPRDCSGTAQILMFFNDLFDSLNGSCLTENELKSPVTESSVHFQYWDYALLMLSQMKFIDKKTGDATNRTKNIQNWESTVRGYYELSKKCLNLGMTAIALRYKNFRCKFCYCPECIRNYCPVQYCYYENILHLLIKKQIVLIGKTQVPKEIITLFFWLKMLRTSIENNLRIAKTINYLTSYWKVLCENIQV